MDVPGTITWEEFLDCAQQLVRLSNEISDHWLFTGDKEKPGGAYLTRREKTFISVDYPIDDVNPGQEDNVEWTTLESHLDKFEAPCSKERPLILEHHVLWSMSYGVPLIYFNGWKSDFPGANPVSVEVAQRLLRNDKLSYAELSQAIHPILGKPYLHLHPCGSRELLLNTSCSGNKLVSWLSFVAPAALNLRLRPEYFQLTVPASETDKTSLN